MTFTSREWVVLAAILLVAGTFARAGPSEDREQEDESAVRSFVELVDQVSTGDTLYVIGRAGDEVEGKLERIATDGSQLTVSVDGESVSFTQEQVQRIDRKHRDSLLNGVLIGAGVGFLTGFLVEAGKDCGSPNETCGAATAMTTAIGAGVGLGIDAARQGRRSVFLSPTGSGMALTVTPFISARRKEVLVSIRF